MAEHLIATTISLTATVNPVSVVRDLVIATSIAVGVSVHPSVFVTPAVAPPPAGLTVKKAMEAVVSMPAPALDQFGRPVQPWVPS